MRLLLNLMCLIMLQSGGARPAPIQDIQQPPVPGGRIDVDTKLPNGKSQNDAILKAEYQKSLQDAAHLVELSRSLQRELRRNGSQVLSLSSLKKAEEIEKTAKQIHDRIRH